MTFSQLLVLAGAVVTPYYKLDNVLEAYSDYSFDIGYSAPLARDCGPSGILQIPFHPDSSVRQHQCFQKCKTDPDDPGCLATDTGGSNVLCLDLDGIKELCTGLGECFGFERVTSSRWLIYTYACQGKMEIGTGADFYFKAISEPPECALGVGVHVSGGIYPVAEGLYEEDGNWPDEATTLFYTQVDGAMASTISWHDSGCGWVLNTDLDVYTPSASAPVAGPSCFDDNEAANFAFGHAGDDAIPDICSVAKEAWGKGSYCSNSIFAAMCPVSCQVPCAFSIAAARDYMTMLGKPIKNTVKNPCSTVPALKCGTSPVTDAICRSTCGRRLSTADTVGMEPEFDVADFRRSMADMHLQALGQRIAESGANEKGTHRRNFRRLDGHMTEVYWSFNSLTCPNPTQSPDKSKLQGAMMYDVLRHVQPVAVKATLSCEEDTKYSVSAVGSYCKHGNVDTPYNAHPAVVNHNCYRKCTLMKPQPTSSIDNGTVVLSGPYPPYTWNKDGCVGDGAGCVGSSTDGETDWCAGNDAEFTPDTNALCLPREECEALCEKLGPACTSIDMHRKFPRCYLNGPGTCDVVESAEYDVLTKITPPAVIAVVDDPSERVSWKTVTGKSLMEIDSLQPAQGTRAECEAECADWKYCDGFVFEGACMFTEDGLLTSARCGNVGRCFYFFSGGEVTLTDYLDQYVEDITEVIPMLDYSVVFKERAAPCTSDVYNAGGFDGHYIHSMACPTGGGSGTGSFECSVSSIATEKGMPAGTFLKPDNTTRIRYGDYECNGWVLESSKKDVVVDTLYNCSDFPGPVNMYFSAITGPSPWVKSDVPIDVLRMMAKGLTPPVDENATDGNVTDEEMNITMVGGKDFPCQWGADTGFCEKDAVFAAMCQHTCTPLLMTLLADEMHAYQSEIPPSVQGSPCGQDNDAAMVSFAQVFYPELLTDGDTCAEMMGGGHYNTTHSPCHLLDLSPVIEILCWGTCQNTELIVTTTTPMPVYDEGSLKGSVDRRLGYAGMSYFAMKFAPMTTSYGGSDDGVSVLSYICGVGCGSRCATECSASEDKWEVAYMSFPKRGDCPSMPTGLGRYLKLPQSDFYSAAMPVVQPPVDVKLVCRSPSSCPELTTCVLTANRYADELASFRKPGLVARSEWLSSLDTKSLSMVMSEFVPKTIISDSRADAMIAGTKAMAEFIGLLYRSVPGGSMVRLPPARKYRQYADKTFVTLAPARYDGSTPIPASREDPSRSGLWWAQVEMGRTYRLPEPNYWKGSTFMTDVIRVERFSDVWLPEGYMSYPPATAGSFTFDLYAPGVKELTMYVYPMMTDTPILLSDFGGTVEKVVGPGEIATGWFQITLPSVEVDVVGVEDLDECAAGVDTCDPNAVCTNLIGKGFTCECVEGFSGDGDTTGSGCLLEPEVYDSLSQEYYFRLKHNDRMDYGWRVKELKMYTDPACTQPYAYTGPVNVPGNYPRTGNTVHTADKLFDGIVSSEWWSSSLTLNPEIVDGTHGGAVVLEWVVPGDVVIECVEIMQNGQHMSKDLTLTRGSTKGPDCGMDGEVCEPTMMWSVKPQGERATFDTRCGVADTQFFGEILVLPHTTGAGWIGNFAEIQGQADPVPSACHCMALCIQYINEGCRSYKYYDSGGVKHCYLQSNLFSPGQGYWGTPGTPGAATSGSGGMGTPGQWPGWRSGTPAESRPRLLGFTPTKVEAGEPFTLEISAVGLPYDADENYNTAPRQRVKIMEADKDCKEKPPMEVTGIGCTETVRKVVTGKGTREEVVYTICSPRPTYADSETLTFGPISISAASEGKEYKVCYCAGQCYEPSSYRVVPGRISFPKSTWLWTLDPPMVYRKEVSGSPAMLTVSVQRPVFGSFSDPNNWELKVVRDYFGCGVVGDTSKFKCTSGILAEPDRGDKDAPVILWDRSLPAPASNATDLLPVTIGDNEAWQLTFDEPVTTSGCTGYFYLKVAGTVNELPCSSVIASNTLAYLNFGTSPSGKAGLEWDTGAVMDMNGNALVGSNTTGLALFKIGESASTPEIVVSMPKNGGQNVLTGSNITLYTAVGGLTQVGNLTFIDCGEDGVCGSKDDSYFMQTDYFADAQGVKITIIPLRTLLPGHRYQIYFEPYSILSSSGGNVMPYSYEFMAECPLPSYLDSQDQASWVFEMDLDVTDAGQYAICFREKGGSSFAPIPGELTNYMTVHKIAADRTHPRGIFHNQQFSALTGSAKPLSITLAGTRVPTPTDSKIAITAGKTCGAAAGFKGVPVAKMVSEDVQQPLPIIEDFLPEASGGSVTVSARQAFVLKFTEPVTVDGCRGNFSFVPTDTTAGNPAKSYPCSMAFAEKDKVILQNTGLSLDSGVSYFLRVDTGAVKDHAGNEMTILNTNNKYEITVEDDTTGPYAVHSFPCDDCSTDLWWQDFETGEWYWGWAVIYLSEQYDSSASGDKYIKLTDCGADYVCDANDPAVEYFLVSRLAAISGGVEWNRLYIPLHNITAFRRYQLTIPADSFKELNTDTEGPGSAQVIEFEYEATGFYHQEMVIPASMESEAGGLVYDLSLLPSMDPTVEYTVCYCDEQKDFTLEDLGDSDTTFKLYDDLKCSETVYPVDVADVTVAGLPAEEHQCESKCAKGCTGPFCFCSGYDDTAGDETLCLSPALCREACDASSDCVGINIHDDKPQCVLIPRVSECVGGAVNGTAAEGLDSVEDWQLYVKLQNTACTHLSDFSERAGSLFVTSRVEVSVDYVLEPGKDGSIEVTAPEGFAALTYQHPRVGDFTPTSLLSGDRITIIDCKGTCGVSSPTTALVLPEHADKISTWNDLYPYSWFVDAPHVDTENPKENSLDYAYSTGMKMYTTHDNQYCSEGNIDLDTAEVPFDGIKRKIKEHQCYTKCSKNAPCEGDDCFCNGLYSSYDGPESNALCADTQLCQYMCDQLEGCTSIDMHKDIDRCFLNMGCDMQKGLKSDPNYMLLIKNKEANDEQAGTTSATGGGRRLLPGKEQGFSWDKMLRFKPVEFKSGGTFKLCFCDSTILGPGQVCSTEKDYKIEVGTIHASGVSCLIKNPKLQRVSCEDQFHGGWRCYEHMEAPRPPPPVIGITPLPVPEYVTDLDINTLCRFMPEEEAKADPRCQTVAGFQSTNPLRK
jgi:hypothetical protein